MKKILKFLTSLVALLLIAALAFVGYLSFTEYRPEARSFAATEIREGAAVLESGQSLTLISWNTGYAGLDKSADFFMDGGSMVMPTSQTAVEDNMAAIADFLTAEDADIYLLQEVDRNSGRTEGVDELAYYRQKTGLSWAYGVNYRCKFVPYPWPPLGRMESGVATMTGCLFDSVPLRISLPCPFSWPVRVANMKRCLVLTRFPLEGSDRELVVVNLHLEAYDDGAGKAAQTQALLAVLQEEYDKGNYVIAGGDFNQTFPGGLDAYPIVNEALWTPGTLDDGLLPEGWRYVYDTAVPSCRLLNQPYDPDSGATQYYVIDGFLVSPNVTVNAVETMDLDFANSDHNPVRLEVSLNP